LKDALRALQEILKDCREFQPKAVIVWSPPIRAGKVMTQIELEASLTRRELDLPCI